MFDEPAPAFGRFRVTAALGDGRFGLVHLGVDPETDQVVVIRTFTGRLAQEQQERLLRALQELCDRPLDHASVATPIACGLDNGVPYLVHAYLPGTSVDEFLRAHGPRPLAEVTLRVAHLAGALDFAAAAGVFHGSLSPRDIIFASQSTGVAGFGLVQAMHGAGVDVTAPTRVDDIYALAAMTFELLVGYRFTGGSVRDALAPLRGVSGVDFDLLVNALEPALSADPSHWPDTALAFASALHAAQIQSEVPPNSTSRPASAIGRLSFGLDDAEPPTIVGTPAAPARDSGLAHAAAGGMTFDAPPHPTTAEAPYEFGAAPVPVDAPVSVQASEETPSAVSEQAPAPAFVPEPAYAAEPSYAEEPSYTPTPAFVPDLEFDREPAHDAHATYHGADSLSLDPLDERLVAEPPVLSAARDEDRSGWRVFALAAIAATVVIAAVVLYLMRGTIDTAADNAAPGDAAVSDAGAVPTEEVKEPQPITPSASAGSDPSDAGVQPVAPVVPEPTAPSSPRTAAEPPFPPVAVPPAEPVPSRRTRREPAPPESASPAAAGAAPRTAPRPSPRTPAAAAAESPAATGRVLVRSTPAGARVLVNGMLRGETPLAIRDLEFGTHTIVVEAPGYPRWQQTVTLSAERPAQSFEIALDNPGAASSGSAAPLPASGLQIDSRPAGAQVWIDGVPAGVTPLSLPNVSVGAHAVRIELAGFRPWSTSVAVKTGTPARVAASLEQ